MKPNFEPLFYINPWLKHEQNQGENSWGGTYQNWFYELPGLICAPLITTNKKSKLLKPVINEKHHQKNKWK